MGIPWRPLAAMLLAAGCAIPPPPPSPDPIRGGLVQEGRLAAADPAETAFCVSQAVPISHVLLVSDGAAVRPAPGVVAADSPDYPLTLRRGAEAPPGLDWRLQVASTEPGAAAAAERLTGTFFGCAAQSGGG